MDAVAAAALAAGARAAQHRADVVEQAMKPDDNIIGTLFVQFALMSLLAFGGANAVVPEIHRQAIEMNGWMIERQFADMVAISQAAPGPNVMIVTLVGFHVAGFWGALVATFAMCGPTAILAAFVERGWARFRDKPWRAAIQAGLVPISVGLVGASAVVITDVAVHNWGAIAIAAVTAGVTYFTRWSPLWMISAAALAGYLGWV
jgi:chromate transporter